MELALILLSIIFGLKLYNIYLLGDSLSKIQFS